MGSIVSLPVFPKVIKFADRKNFRNATGYSEAMVQGYGTVYQQPVKLSGPVSKMATNPVVVSVYPGQQPTVFQKSGGMTSGQYQLYGGTITPAGTATVANTPIRQIGNASGNCTGANLICTTAYSPVKGASGTVYTNKCYAEKVCDTPTTPYVSPSAGGSSDECPKNINPVVCPDNYIYDNECIAASYGQSGCTPYSQYAGGGSTGGGGFGGGGGGFDMSAPMTEGPGMAGTEPIGYDEQGNAIYGYDENGVPIYGLDENGNVINDPTKAKEAKAKELGLQPVDKTNGKRLVVFGLAALAVMYLTFK